MSKWEIIRRPELEPHDGAVDPREDWRRFVLDQVGYDEVARDRIERRTMRRAILRRFLRSMLFGLIVYALAFAVVLAALSWREGRFDRWLPHKDEAADPVLPARAPERLLVDTANPMTDLPDALAPPARRPAASDEAESDDPAQADATPTENDD